MLVIPRRVYLFHQAQGTTVVFIHEDGDVVGTAGGGDDNGVFGARDGVIGVMGGGGWCAASLPSSVVAFLLPRGLPFGWIVGTSFPRSR